MDPTFRVSSNGNLGQPPLGRALIAADMLNSYLAAALEVMPEAKILEVLRKCGIEGVSDLASFRARLDDEVNFPVALFESVGCGLIDAGLVQERAMYLSHTRKIPLRSVTKMNLTLMSELAEQKLGKNLLDVVTISLLKVGAYEPIFCNSICGDAVIERRQGNRFGLRIFYAMLHPEMPTWFWFHHVKCLLIYCPTNVGEPKAEARFIPGDDFIIEDPRRPDLPLKLPARRSLRELAAKNGIDMKVAEGMVYWNGRAVAAPDVCPGRVMGGMYRAIQDARIVGSEVVIENPSSLVRHGKSFLLIKDHRYHLDRALPMFEIEMDYSIHRFRMTAFSAALVLSRKLWTFFTGSDVNPWRGLQEIMIKRTTSATEKAVDAYALSFMTPPREAPRSLPLPQKVEYFKVQFNLTARESEVLTEIVNGRSNREIAEELSISELTAKTHVSNILSKTGFASRQKLMHSFTSS